MATCKVRDCLATGSLTDGRCAAHHEAFMRRKKHGSYSQELQERYNLLRAEVDDLREGLEKSHADRAVLEALFLAANARAEDAIRKQAALRSALQVAAKYAECYWGRFPDGIPEHEKRTVRMGVQNDQA